MNTIRQFFKVKSFKGAQWIHGTEGNPVYELSKSIGNIDETERNDETMLYASQGKMFIINYLWKESFQ